MKIEVHVAYLQKHPSYDLGYWPGDLPVPEGSAVQVLDAQRSGPDMHVTYVVLGGTDAAESD